MTPSPYPDDVDFAALISVLRGLCGTSVRGATLGRKRLRDEVARQLNCSTLVSERCVDTLIARGFIRQQVHREGWVYWAVD